MREMLGMLSMMICDDLVGGKDGIKANPLGRQSVCACVFVCVCEELYAQEILGMD